MADELQAGVAQQRAGEQVGLGQYLKPVADAHDRPTALGEAHDLGHDRAEPRHRTAADVVTVGEAARQHERVETGELRVAVPHVAGLEPSVRAACTTSCSQFEPGKITTPSRIGYASPSTTIR
jgi:hypothetical protein